MPFLKGRNEELGDKFPKLPTALNKDKLGPAKTYILRATQKVGYGMVVDGIAKFQALKFTFQCLKSPEKIPCFAG